MLVNAVAMNCTISRLFKNFEAHCVINLIYEVCARVHDWLIYAAVYHAYDLSVLMVLQLSSDTVTL